MSSFAIDLDLSDFKDFIDAEEQKVHEAARPTAQAGAQVLYDAVKRNVSALGKKTGNLSRSIYQAYSENNSSPGLATYHVSWNAKKAPHGHLVENGYIKKYKVVLNKKSGKWITMKNEPLTTPVHVPGKYFVRRAETEFPRAYDAMRDEFLRRIGA